ncbi:hypothetical protein F511_36471 [Dorcoceras hygrometricum]|uniref:Uncharacterized protein n=1 Tax=Dorcoceras hygrometricum TaxID=472368 RepID=A0A2Z7AD28_9LAMI|nr:hypothetical protein F511_36471 [Dorcoceras hygrometricum]
MSTAELNSKWRKRQMPAKEKDASTFTLQRSVAHLWKEDNIAFWSAEEFWKLSNGKNFAEAIYWRRRPLKKKYVERVNETLCVRSVGATTYCEDNIAFWSVEEFWKLSNGKNFAEAIYWRRRPLKKKSVERVNETLCVRSVGATTYCGRITLHIQCTNRGKNREIDEAINRH